MSLFSTLTSNLPGSHDNVLAAKPFAKFEIQSTNHETNPKFKFTNDPNKGLRTVIPVRLFGIFEFGLLEFV